jgi:hypothetical protein
MIAMVLFGSAGLAMGARSGEEISVRSKAIFGLR